MSLYHAVDLDYQIKQARKVKRLTAQNNRLKECVKKLLETNSENFEATKQIVVDLLKKNNES